VLGHSVPAQHDGCLGKVGGATRLLCGMYRATWSWEESPCCLFGPTYTKTRDRSRRVGAQLRTSSEGRQTVPECAHVVVKALRCAPRERDDAKRERGRGCIGLDTPSSTPRFDELLHETGIARPALDESTRPGAAAPAPAAGPCAAFIVALKHVVLAWQSYDTHAIAREQPDPASYWQRWVMRAYLGTTRRP
jgi:hypothetical protein